MALAPKSDGSDAPPRVVSRTAEAYGLLTIAALAWAGNAIASRLAVGEVSPMALTSLRWLAVLVVFALGYWRSWRDQLSLLHRHWPFALVMGAAGYTGFNALMYLAAHHTPALNLVILQGAMPVMVLVGALWLYGTPVTWLQAGGVLVTLLGVLVVASKGDWHVLRTLSFNFGDVLMLLAGALYSGYTLFLRRRPDVPGMTLFFLMGIGAFLSSIPLVAAEAAIGALQWPTAKGWAIVIYTGLLPSLLAQRFFMRGVDLIGPGRATLFINLVPVFGALSSIMVLGETFSLYHATALALVLGGIVLAEQRVMQGAPRRGGSLSGK